MSKKIHLFSSSLMKLDGHLFVTRDFSLMNLGCDDYLCCIRSDSLTSLTWGFIGYDIYEVMLGFFVLTWHMKKIEMSLDHINWRKWNTIYVSALWNFLSHQLLFISSCYHESHTSLSYFLLILLYFLPCRPLYTKRVSWSLVSFLRCIR